MSEENNEVKPKYSNHNNNEIFDAVMNAICKVTEGVDSVLKSEEYESNHLCHLINSNQKLLESIKIGTLLIDEIICIANKHNVGCKISGAGFGGCLLAVYNTTSDVPAFITDIENLKDKNVSFIVAEFSKHGVECDSWEHH